MFKVPLRPRQDTPSAHSTSLPSHPKIRPFTAMRPPEFSACPVTRPENGSSYRALPPARLQLGMKRCGRPLARLSQRAKLHNPTPPKCHVPLSVKVGPSPVQTGNLTLASKTSTNDASHDNRSSPKFSKPLAPPSW